MPIEEKVEHPAERFHAPHTNVRHIVDHGQVAIDTEKERALMVLAPTSPLLVYPDLVHVGRH